MSTRIYRVRVYFIGDAGDLLAISSRLLSYQTARRLVDRLKPLPTSSLDDRVSPQLSLHTPPARVPALAIPYDVLDAEMYSVKNPKPLQDGARQVQRLDEYGIERI